MTTPIPWKISLHGGHGKDSCDHAADTLENLVSAAVDFGYRTFGITEHVPRVEESRIFPEERALGWDVAALERNFAAYAARVDTLKAQWAGQITLLKGFEIEVVPETAYVALMQEYKQRYGFEYMVGSVHFVAGYIIDYMPEEYARAVEACGGPEALAVRYYQTVAEMALALRPEVVGHFDLVRMRFPDEDSAATPAIRRAALEALEAVRTVDGILDINTAGYRKGLGRPYPAAWILDAARDMNIAVCFGDDSHQISHVGAGLEEARAYLLGLGINHITALAPGNAGMNREVVALA